MLYSDKGPVVVSFESVDGVDQVRCSDSIPGEVTREHSAVVGTDAQDPATVGADSGAASELGQKSAQDGSAPGSFQAPPPLTDDFPTQSRGGGEGWGQGTGPVSGPSGGGGAGWGKDSSTPPSAQGPGHVAILVFLVVALAIIWKLGAKKGSSGPALL